MPTRTRLRGRTITRALTATVAALALTATVSCGQPETTIEQADDKPDKPEQQPKDNQPTPSPSPTFEEEPYVQVALDYYEAVNEATRTGDVQRLRDMSTDDCDACRGTADSIEQIHKDGGHSKGGKITPVPDQDISGEVTDNGTAYVTIIFKYDEQVLVRKKGGEREEFDAELQEKNFTLKREGSEWLITKLTTSDPED